MAVRGAFIACLLFRRLLGVGKFFEDGVFQFRHFERLAGHLVDLHKINAELVAQQSRALAHIHFRQDNDVKIVEEGAKVFRQRVEIAQMQLRDVMAFLASLEERDALTPPAAD